MVHRHKYICAKINNFTKSVYQEMCQNCPVMWTLLVVHSHILSWVPSESRHAFRPNFCHEADIESQAGRYGDKERSKPSKENWSHGCRWVMESMQVGRKVIPGELWWWAVLVPLGCSGTLEELCWWECWCPGMLRDIRGSCSASARIPCLRQEAVIRVDLKRGF